MDEQVIALAQTIPTWKAIERFYPGVEATSTQDGPDAPEVVQWPEGFTPPTKETLFAHKLHLAREFLSTGYRRDRAEAFAERPIGDQLDALIKGLAALSEAGTDLPEDTVGLIRWSNEIKAKYPKPKGPDDGD